MLGRGGMGNIMKQAQMMQKRMAQVQQELEERRIEASAGGGMVTAVVSGKQQLISLTIDPKAVDPDDVEMLQDLVMVAVSEALKQSQKLADEEMGKVTGGLKSSWFVLKTRGWRLGAGFRTKINQDEKFLLTLNNWNG